MQACEVRGTAVDVNHVCDELIRLTLSHELPHERLDAQCEHFDTLVPELAHHTPSLPR